MKGPPCIHRGHSLNVERDKKVIALRASGLTLAEVAERCGVSKSRIGQIEKRVARVGHYEARDKAQ